MADVKRALGDSRLPGAFWSRVEPSQSGCWLWVGARASGYGIYNAARSGKCAHRVAYEQLVGPIPDGQRIGQSCRNRACVNPAHLYTGAQLGVFDDLWMPEPNTGCWLWIGHIGARGYGVFRRGKKLWRAHRVSYERSVGPIPEGLLVCHRCDTPACVNPDHLFLGTAQDNTDDMVAKGRGRTPAADAQRAKTHCKHGHAFTPENILWIGPKRAWRTCMTCERMRKAQAWAQRRAHVFGCTGHHNDE